MVFIGILTGTLILCLFFNVFFIKQVYIRYSEKALIDTYNQINTYSKIYSFTSKEFHTEIRNLCERHSLSIILMDGGNRVVASYQASDMTLREHLLDYFLGNINTDQEVEIIKQDADLNYTLQMVNDETNGSDYLELVGTLENGDFFLIRTAVEGLEYNAFLANRFFIEIGAIALLCGVSAILYFTGKITKPILQLTDISERMTNLDFDARYITKGENEIDCLGENMNKMSKKLESTISELKTANNELKMDIKKKEEIDEKRKEFISNVSHELKTPIALIQGYAEGLKEGMVDSPEDRAFYCDVIIDESRRMNAMVKNLLSLNELESGFGKVTMERVNISEMIKNCVASLEVMGNGKNITIENKIPDYCFVWSDEYKTEEVFRNFFSNALNHVSDNGTIIVDSVKKDKKIRINVFNTGKNIPEESLPYIWDKFYKVDKARTRAYGGSGVGLSIVKAIMEALDQNYGVENKEDGVLFYFELATE